MSKPQIRISSSALKNLHCDRKFYLEVLKGYKTKNELKFDNPAMQYGTCLHRFAEVYVQDYNEREALMAMIKKRKSATLPTRIPKRNAYLFDDGHLMGAALKLQKFLDEDRANCEVVKTPNGTTLSEFQFGIPYASYPECDILICGTIDKVTKIRGGRYALGDYKSTTAWDQTSFFNGYLIDVQPRMYRWAMRWFAKEYPDSIYEEIAGGPLGFYIDGIFLTKDEVTVKRSPVFHDYERDNQEFSALLASAVARIVWLNSHDRLPLRTGTLTNTCREPYGLCKYAGVCSMPDARGEETLLAAQYKQKMYDPLNY